MGLEVDKRNRLFVAGGVAGGAWVYDAHSGALLASYQFTRPHSGLVNDVVVTSDAAYFTDSFRLFLYVVPLGPAGELGSPASVRRIALTGDLQYRDEGADLCPAAPGINANGIEAGPDGHTLIIGQTNTGLLFSVDPIGGVTKTIDLDGPMASCSDGLLRRGRHLYVVQGLHNHVAGIRLNTSYTAGRLADIIADPDLDSPATAARFGRFLYVVNARFSTPRNPTPPIRSSACPAESGRDPPQIV